VAGLIQGIVTGSIKNLDRVDPIMRKKIVAVVGKTSGHSAGAIDLSGMTGNPNPFHLTRHCRLYNRLCMTLCR